MLPEHWDSVKKIYELGIATGIATFETKAPEWKEWSKNHLLHSRFICLVDERVAGWVALSPVSGRCVYGGVAETSIYIHPYLKNMGIGIVLMEHLIRESENNGIWTLQATIFEENKASIRLHEKSGFRKVGYREKIGQLNGVWHHTVLFERRSKIVNAS